MADMLQYLTGGDLRSIADVHKVVTLVNSQSEFDKLFQYLLMLSKKLPCTILTI